MTYCVGTQLEDGLVMLSDSLTHAGVDQIATFRKMSIWEPGDRILVLMTAGNLASSQAVVSLLHYGRDPQNPETLYTVKNMYEAACAVGDAVREVWRRDGEALKAHNIDAGVTLMLGGQISGGPMKLYQIYSAGNFIEATPETPYFQIGETKYGKPILDRVISPSTSLKEAAKCALVSMDSTLRSNISVGLPLDLVVYRRDSLRLDVRRKIDESDPYFLSIRKRWGEGLRDVFQTLPDPDWAA